MAKRTAPPKGRNCNLKVTNNTNGELVKLDGVSAKPTGLIARKNTTEAQWDAALKMIAALDKASPWLIGDGLNQKRWGDKYKEGVALFDREEESLRNIV